VRVLLFILLSSFAFATLYEDAEDGDTQGNVPVNVRGWFIYDNSPANAVISNVYDSDKKSKVIQFQGTDSTTNNGYMLGDWYPNSEGSLNNTNEFNVHWSMKYSENWVVYLRVYTTQDNGTDDGKMRYIYYTGADSNFGAGERNRYIHHGLGSAIKDGKWHMIHRDLQADLEEFDPGNKITSVVGFLIRGNGRIDDIYLTSGATITEPMEAIVPTCTNPISKLKMTTYDTTGYNNYPDDSNRFETLIQDYSTNLFGTGLVSQINGSGNPYGTNENYLSIFKGYIYLPTTGVYAFGVDGDDAIEVYIDDTLITGWYGGHGKANQAKFVVNVYAQSGWHKLEYHHQEKSGGDYYYLYWQKPNGNLEMVPSSQLFHCVDAKMSVNKSSCVLSDLVSGTVNPKRIPGSTIRYAIEVKNEGSSVASDVKVSDSVGENFNETTIRNLQIQSGACDCLGITSSSNNGVNGTADGVNPVVLDFGEVLGGSVSTPTRECGYFEVKIK
jgi:uncharacterized repeat protein (TIGR01451 family)